MHTYIYTFMIIQVSVGDQVYSKRYTSVHDAATDWLHHYHSAALTRKARLPYQECLCCVCLAVMLQRTATFLVTAYMSTVNGYSTNNRLLRVG